MLMLCEEIRTSLKFLEWVRRKRKNRIKEAKKFKPDYCDCFKPCYWHPTSLIKQTFQNLAFRLTFRS